MSQFSIYSRFLALNAVVLVLVASRYFIYLPEDVITLPVISYGVASLFSHITLLTFILGSLGYLFTLLPAHLFRLLSVTLATVGLVVLFGDTMIFASYRFHLNLPVLLMVLSGQVVTFPLLAWLGVAVAIVCVFWIEFLLFRLCCSQQNWLTFAPKRVVKLFFLTLLLSHGMHAWAKATAYQNIPYVNEYLPLFYPTSMNSLLAKYGIIDKDELAKRYAQSPTISQKLNYPRNPLNYNKAVQQRDIMLIVIDSWRFDSLTNQYMPFLFNLAQEGVSLAHHYSAGNSTRMGMFGLFYSLPGPYWHSILANQRSSILIDALQERQYQLGLYASARLDHPEFNRTIFSKVENLRLKSESEEGPAQRDIEIVQKWQQWYQGEEGPKFSFLFFDAPHAYDFPKDQQVLFEPMSPEYNPVGLNNNSDPLPLKNRYYTSTYFIDTLIKQVITTLKQAGKYEDTLIIITGDHGEEINDNKQGYWGHNGNFSTVQTKVPFIVLGEGSQHIDLSWLDGAMTTHYDFVPTLLKHYLGVTNPIDDYGVGADLYAKAVVRPYFITADYGSYAVINKETMLDIRPNGLYEVKNMNNERLEDQSLDSKKMQFAIDQLTKFNR